MLKLPLKGLLGVLPSALQKATLDAGALEVHHVADAQDAAMEKPVLRAVKHRADVSLVWQRLTHQIYPCLIQ
jgi:hypothetical protein